MKGRVNDCLPSRTESQYEMDGSADRKEQRVRDTLRWLLGRC